MVYYADTSWWLAVVNQPDVHHRTALRIFELDPVADILWTPWQRVEVFNSLHQMERIGALRPGEANRLVRTLEADVRDGLWTHKEFSWINAVRRAAELARKHGPSLAIRGMDLFHVAVAVTVRAEVFLTFDDDQKALAQAAGLIDSQRV